MGALYYQYIFFTFSRQKNRSIFDLIFCPYPASSLPTPRPLWGRYIINIFFLPFPDKKIGHFSTSTDTPLNTPGSPLSGRYIINTVFPPFPDKKIGRFSTVFACPYFTVTARGCQSLVPCFSLISWSCTRILFFLSTTALGCAFNVLLHACTVAPNAVTAFIIRCHRSHVNPFTRPKNDFFV